MPGGPRTLVASVADVDDSGNEIEGTGRYASSVAPSSPAKEQPNTGRARREKARRASSPITASAVTDSDSTLQPRGDSAKKPSKDREKSASSKKALMAASRPAGKHGKTSRRASEAAYYGVDPSMSPAVSRPAPQSRPSSFYGPSRPPPSNARFYASQTPGPSLPAPFPPPSWMGPGPPPPPGPGPVPSHFGPPPSSAPLVTHHPPPQTGPDLFARPLELRFGTSRPQSAMSFRQPPALEYDDDYEDPVERSLTRRPSTTRRASKHEDDRKAMPPPRRPASARPTALAFRPPPATPARRRTDYDDPGTDVEDPLFNDISPPGPGSYDHTRHFPPQRGFGADFGYDVPDYQTEVAGRRRRNTYYGGHSGSSGSLYEDKIRLATQYQDAVGGGAQVPLTAETLRKAGRSGTSSRSTRSSGSHDESEYRRSATTRTTRSTAANDEDVTIKVKGSTVLKFGNTEMQCQDGAEINITSRSGNAEIRATGSDRSSYTDREDDRRTRVDIPKSRARATSRAKSRPRSFSHNPSKYELGPKYDIGPPRGYEYVSRYDDFDADYDGYTTYTPPLPPPPPPSYPEILPPPYPEFPSSYSSRHGDAYYGGPPY
ncbi:uncharacterized protein P884DRAFT_301821 [Thermothelomyces heterothallicus CBS 202.75]|uniref:uncharacterized protein n=1 Tax=Thermothelomyces heterothallicus CBS 202.75 TaxID=1149848 RepID=UPI0037439121